MVKRICFNFSTDERRDLGTFALHWLYKVEKGGFSKHKIKEISFEDGKIYVELYKEKLDKI